jgi:hypothetical protein
MRKIPTAIYQTPQQLAERIKEREAEALELSTAEAHNCACTWMPNCGLHRQT